MNLRDEIRDALMTYENDIRSVASGAEYQDTTTAAADAILAKVREALLSDEALEAAVDVAEPFPHIMRDDLKRHMHGTITAALDAITTD